MAGGELEVGVCQVCPRREGASPLTAPGVSVDKDYHDESGQLIHLLPGKSISIGSELFHDQRYLNASLLLPLILSSGTSGPLKATCLFCFKLTLLSAIRLKSLFIETPYAETTGVRTTLASFCHASKYHTRSYCTNVKWF